MIQLSRKLVSNVCIALGAVGLIDFFSLMLIKAVMNFGIVFPGVVGVFLLTLGIFLRRYNSKSLIIGNTLFTKIIIIALVLSLTSFFFIEALILSAIKPDYNVQVDYLIILGAGLKGDQMTLTFKNRTYKGLEFLKENPKVKVVVSGGQGADETISEAEAMRRYLVEHGIDENRIIKEEKSTSTMENFKFSRKLIQDKDNKQKYRIMIVTSDFHMYRAKMIGRRNGFITYGLPSKTWWAILPNCCIREYFAMIKSFVVDR